MKRSVKQISLLVVMVLLLSFCNRVNEVSEAQGNAVLKGTVSAVAPGNSMALGDIMVILQGTEKTTVTDSKGNFTISGIKPGRYVLITSSKLYHPVEHEITVTGDTTTVPIHLLPN